jgi:hypothetical protein
MLHRRPIRPSLEPAADRFALRRHDQQGADRRLGGDHGEDSDFIRVRVRGVFPRTGSPQFIDGQRVDEAVARPLVEDPTAPLIMGVDIARQGADQSVIRFRRGLDARGIPAVKFRIPDLMQVASRVMEQVNSHNPDAVFVDGTGIGWGVHDRLNQLGCPNSWASISAPGLTAPTPATPRRATPTSAPRCGAS